MKTQIPEKQSVKSPRYRKILWSAFIVNFFIAFMIFAVSILNTGIVSFWFTIFVLLSLVLLIILMFTSKKYYNWTLPFLGVFFLGLFFKYHHLAGAGALITQSAILIFLNLLFFAVKAFFVLKHNSFLKWLSFASSIALALFMYVFGFKVMHWPLFMPFWMLKIGINAILIFVSLTLIFKLSGLDFSSWSDFDRKVFYRLILLPFIIVFAFSIITTIFPNSLTYIFAGGDLTTNPWGMEPINLFDLEGIKL